MSAPQGTDRAAFWCPQCKKVFAPPSAGICPEDGTPLEPAGIPFLFGGRYLFESRLGAGGMGTVWRARDLSLGRVVAVKTLPLVSARGGARIRREARAAARFLHPNLAAIFTTEIWDGVPLLVFEYLEGGTLSQRIREGPCDPSDVVRWGVALSGALAAAHAGGVLHRDMKPSNIGFTPDGTPKLLDFGLAAVHDEAGTWPASALGEHGTESSLEETVSRLTRTSALVGTIPYLAPEAVLGDPPGPSFDLWGLTLSLYEAVTDRNPFMAGTASATLNRIVSQRIPDPRTLRPSVPAALAEVLVRNLDREPTRRAASAAVLRAEFLALSGPRF